MPNFTFTNLQTQNPQSIVFVKKNGTILHNFSSLKNKTAIIKINVCTIFKIKWIFCHKSLKSLFFTVIYVRFAFVVLFCLVLFLVLFSQCFICRPMRVCDSVYAMYLLTLHVKSSIWRSCIYLFIYLSFITFPSIQIFFENAFLFSRHFVLF